MKRIWMHPVFDAVLLALVFMRLAPVGSFDPGTVGFWISIVFGLFTSFAIRFLITKLQKDAKDTKTENRF